MLACLTRMRASGKRPSCRAVVWSFRFRLAHPVATIMPPALMVARGLMKFMPVRSPKASLMDGASSVRWRLRRRQLPSRLTDCRAPRHCPVHCAVDLGAMASR